MFNPSPIDILSDSCPYDPPFPFFPFISYVWLPIRLSTFSLLSSTAPRISFSFPFFFPLEFFLLLADLGLSQRTVHIMLMRMGWMDMVATAMGGMRVDWVAHAGKKKDFFPSSIPTFPLPLGEEGFGNM
jgi:hypothetical protein